MNKPLPSELISELEKLKEDDVARVLTYTRSLTMKDARGARGSDLLKYAGTISKEDLDKMSAAVEEACERIEPT